jgi:spore germination cell wall hydrolase CwlJ-like protein
MNDEISFIDITDGALFYHADNIRPSWAKTKKRTTKIGNHIFYK